MGIETEKGFWILIGAYKLVETLVLKKNIKGLDYLAMELKRIAEDLQMGLEGVK